MPVAGTGRNHRGNHADADEFLIEPEPLDRRASAWVRNEQHLRIDLPKTTQYPGKCVGAVSVLRPVNGREHVVVLR